MNKVFVIAGNKSQADIILRTNKKQQLSYISSRENLYGLRNPIVLLCGHYFQRDDWEEIQLTLKEIDAHIIDIRY